MADAGDRIVLHHPLAQRVGEGDRFGEAVALYLDQAVGGVVEEAMIVARRTVVGRDVARRSVGEALHVAAVVDRRQPGGEGGGAVGLRRRPGGGADGGS
ncbi:MAG: hypothetical protein WD489_08825, partial [Rhodovibrionaceae bacterium]